MPAVTNAFAENLLMLRGLLLLLLVWPIAAQALVVAHQFEIVLKPLEAGIEVIDHLQVPVSLIETNGSVRFSLSRFLSPSVDGSPLIPLPADPEQPEVRHYRVFLDESARVSLRYTGRIVHPEHFESGHIGSQGVYLSAAARWYPRFGRALHRFTMTVRLPPDWRAVSQGAGVSSPGAANWVETRPQDEIYLIAAPFHVFTLASPIAEAQVYLRDDDEELALRYLEATEKYLAFYDNLLGPYPYPKFALVENFWETGYGMPSFTLLGPRVIRLPFIIHTSYPHEILHNWWGNGVFVDYADGNWSEGLTAYLADHLLRERRGLGPDYRRDALQKYRTYVSDAEDFSLRAFIGKHGEASQAVGYNKALMFFHTLRRRLGDETFLAGLRRFYAEQRFKRAGYRDLRAAFERVSGEDLKLEFDQWTRRVGAPVIALEAVGVQEVAGGFRIEGRLRQTQAGRAYAMTVPLMVQTSASPVEVLLRLDSDVLDFVIDLETRPYRLVVDPGFDVFRRLDPSELPASLDELLAGGPGLAIIPSAIGGENQNAYRALAQGLGASPVMADDELDHLPDDEVVWLFGWENRFLPTIAGELERSRNGSLTRRRARLDTRVQERHQTCSVLVERRQSSSGRSIAFVGCDAVEVATSLARRLPHYGKYSYLGFDTQSGQNVLKGKWTVADSVMSVRFVSAGDIPPLKLPPRAPLIDLVLDR